MTANVQDRCDTCISVFVISAVLFFLFLCHLLICYISSCNLTKSTGMSSFTAAWCRWRRGGKKCQYIVKFSFSSENGGWGEKECLSFLITLLSFTLHPPYSLVALRRDVNLTVNAVRKWLVQEGQELEMGIRR